VQECQWLLALHGNSVVIIRNLANDGGGPLGFRLLRERGNHESAEGPQGHGSNGQSGATGRFALAILV